MLALCACVLHSYPISLPNWPSRAVLRIQRLLLAGAGGVAHRQERAFVGAEWTVVNKDSLSVGMAATALAALLTSASL